MGIRRKRILIDEKLKDWATPRQAEYIDAVNEHGSLRNAAAKIGADCTTISKSITAVKKKAILHGWSPEHGMINTVPAPFIVSGISTLTKDANGNRQWVKSKLDDAKRQEMLEAAVLAMSGDIKPVAPITSPEVASSNLLNLYTLTDSHVGMRAWGYECGEDWDLEIAERTIYGAIENVINRSPDAEIGFLNQLGDWLHYDSLTAVTPLHQNVLDSDGRYPKVIEVAVRILRRVVALMLTKHNRVVVLIAEGNHDLSSSVWLQHLFKLLYENEPRVDVIQSAMPYYHYQHGLTMLAFHHGHLSKNDQLPILFAAQFPKVWGTTAKRYCHTGHRHHVEEKEHSGMTVIQHPTLAARDAYAARGGWIADRSLTAITYHRDFGQVARTTVTPEMLKGCAATQ